MRIRWQALCATATLVSLASGSAATAQTESPDAAAVFDQPGLTLALSSSDGATDARVARLAALYVPEGQTASPFLDAGPFEAAFRGAIELDLNDWYRFSVRGSGTVQLSIGGEVVIAPQGLPAGDAPLSTNGEVRLNKGLNPIELVYRSPAGGDASLRLTWGNDYLPEEPLPPERLRRADSPALHRGLARRTARDLVADAMCVRCHAAANGPSDGMPELQETGPDLDGIGSRLRPRWIEEWLLDPKALRPQARMPQVLSTNATEARQQAADLTAYLLASDATTATPRGTSAPTAGTVAEGRSLYDETGCTACHGGPTAHVLRLADQWQPPALAAYMFDPTRFDPWSRMPRTELEADEAASVAAYLLAATPENGEASPVRPDSPGDAERGRRLADEFRCRSCHSLPGGDPPPPAPPVDGLAGRNSTWITSGDTTSNHPRYDLEPTQVVAIERFLTEDVTSLARAVHAEYAERRIRSDGCLSCHSRDGVAAIWSPPSKQKLRTATEDANQSDFASVTDDETGPDLLPPDLTWTGEKLRSDWLADFLSGRTADRPRPHLRVRMPAFAARADLLAAGLHHQHGLPAAPVDVQPIDSELAAIGRDLIRGDRLGCHSCHALGEDPALGGEGSEETINFDLVRRRLRRPYFDWFLRDPQRIQPGSKMPQFVDEDGYTALYDVFDGEAERQFEAIWHYLGTLN